MNMTPSYNAALPLDMIDKSTFQPRRSIDPKKLDELASNIKAVGVQEPIKVRPKNDRFELVFGERRWLASGKAGLRTIPAIVQPMDDATALELAIVENAQREDVHPLDEADGLRLMIEGDKTLELVPHPIEEVAAKIGKSVSYVYGRLKLCSLAPKARKAYLAGKLSTTVAVRIARIPNKELQDLATTEIVMETQGGMRDEEALAHIEASYMLALDQAPFDTDDADLVAKAGSCTACPKRTGNQGVLFDVKRKDLCMDRHCFAEKKAAGYQRKVEDAKAKGARELTKGEIKRTFPMPGQRTPSTTAPYVRVDATIPEDPKGRTWKTLLGKTLPTLHVARLDDEVVDCVKRDDAYAALRKVPKLNWAKRPAPADKPAKAGKADKRPSKDDEAVTAFVTASVLERVVGEVEGTGFTDEALVFLATCLIDGGGFAVRDVADRRRRVEGPKAKGDAIAWLRRHCTDVDPWVTRGIIAELVLAAARIGERWNGKWGAPMKRAAEIWGLDLVDLDRKAREAAIRAAV